MRFSRIIKQKAHTKALCEFDCAVHICTHYVYRIWIAFVSSLDSLHCIRTYMVNNALPLHTNTKQTHPHPISTRDNDQDIEVIAES